MKEESRRVLIVDDQPANRDLLARHIRRLGHAWEMAENGRVALEKLRAGAFDLVLLDIMMPEMSGYQVLEHMQADERLRNVPVIVISAVNDQQSVTRCIELGATDYLFKPFDRVLLRARVSASLMRKAWHDQEQEYLRRIEEEQARSERLLLNVLPAPIAERLKAGEEPIADHFDDVTVLFADLVGFTAYAAELSPAEVVEALNRVYTRFDAIVRRNGLEKIKTIGDAYMAVGGVPDAMEEHAHAAAQAALEMQAALPDINAELGTALQMRIGLNSGPLVAGVIGKHKFSYDVWGDTVNTASRIQNLAEAGEIRVSAGMYFRIRDAFVLQACPPQEVKGKGLLETYVLLDRKE